MPKVAASGQNLPGSGLQGTPVRFSRDISFRRDVQATLDEYLRGDIREQDMLAGYSI